MKRGQFDTRNVYITAWAYSLGGAVGWGAFMMPQNIFLPEAGPLGSVIGIALAAIFMYFIGYCTSYMAKRFPANAGVHVYIREILGADHGFLSAWAILLAYLSILWANSTALILLIRFIWGDVLQFGFHYIVASYDVYFGEIFLTLIVIVVFGYIAMIGRKVVRVLNVLLTVCHVILLVAILVGVIIAGHHSISFGFAKTNVSNPLEVFNILMLAPWMYVGFEAFMYKYDTGERKLVNIRSIMSASVVSIAIAYIIPVLIPVLAIPDGYNAWNDYLAATAGASGLEGLPVFYSTYISLGKLGLNCLIICIICAICTSLFGMYRAAACLMSSMAEGEIMPSFMAKKNKNHEPYIAIITVMFVSAIIPFIGRTAIGWIVDITTISANIVYVYSMVACYIRASEDESAYKHIKIISVIGMILAVTSFLFLLVPNIYSENKIASESYFILAIWSIIVLLYYWYVYSRDEKRLYGKSPIMWVFLAYLIFFSSIMWVRERTEGFAKSLLGWQKDYFSSIIAKNAVIEMLLVIVVLVVLFSLFSILIRRQVESDKKKLEADMKNQAKTAFLFNMSHDIRTPMNAILGFTDLALLDTSNPEKMNDYLLKIKSSGDHLLSLINDILEMSRIESGKLELHNETVDLYQLFGNLDSITRGLAEDKEQSLAFNYKHIKHRYVYTDRLRLNQVLLNLVSNAVKYTDRGGHIVVAINENDHHHDTNSYSISVKDDGMGMSEEFAAKVFEAFERDERADMSGIQGTGLGMAITKKIVDLMGGAIQVNTKLGEGSEFIIEVDFQVAREEDVEKLLNRTEITEMDFKGKRVLLTDDYEINREIATAILESYEFVVEQAVDGKDALEHVIKHPTGYYDLIFLDIQMPVMNGYDAARSIRNLSDKEKALVPIIAMTANAFEEDVKNAKAAGMNGHVAKPIDQKKLEAEIQHCLHKFHKNG